MQVNLNKSKIVVFRKREPLRENEKWMLNNEPIEVVDNFNYLGTVFNYTGNFVLNQEMLVGKSLKALNALLAHTRRFPFKPKTLCQLFDSFVTSILGYACEIWGFGKSKPIERVHLKFCKQILCVKTSTCSAGVYGELGRYPLYINRYVRIIKFWCKVINSSNAIVKHLYRMLLEKCNAGVKNWASNVKALLDVYGFSYIWNGQETMNLICFPTVFKNRVLDVFVQSWHSSVDVSNTLCTYSTFKSAFEYEHNLDVLPKSLRIALSRLRLSSHPLLIETGRYGNNRTERRLRLCTFCNTGDIEDEFHFIVICPLYTDIRKIYIDRYYYKKPSVFKFTELMNSSDDVKLLKLGKFIFKAFSIRQANVTA